MQTTKLKIKGMACANCVARVKKALEAVPGVRSALVRLGQDASVEHNGVSPAELRRAVADAGDYSAEVTG
jgi:copper chaperone CopZ